MFIDYGCGPAKWIYFKVALSDTSVNLIKASVKSKISGIITEYILPVKNGEIKIGHGMCSGAFDLKEEYYEVVFSLLDMSMNEGEKTKPVTFTTPFKNTIEE